MNQKRMGVLLQYTQMGLSILISFIYTPIMLKILGQAEYGIYSLAQSIISYLSLLSLGFGASYIRFYSRFKAKNDSDEISRLNGLFMVVFIVIGIIALICGGLLALNTEAFLNHTYTTAEKKTATILMLIMTFNMALSFPASVFTSYITSQEKFVFQKSLNIIRSVVGPFVTLPVLLLGFGSIGMVLSTTLISIFVDVVNVVFCTRNLKMKFSFNNLNIELLKEIATFSVFIVINQIIDQINWATDKMILGKFCTSAAVAIYSIGAQINTYYLQFSVAISGVFIPEIHKIVNNNYTEKEKDSILTDMFTKIGRIQFMVIMLVLSGFIIFGKYFMNIWAGPEYTNAYYVAVLLIAPVTIPLIQNIGIEIQRAKNKHQFRSFAYLAMAIINIFISIFLAKRYGEIGAAVGTAISLILANCIIMNIYYHKVIKLDIKYFWKEIFKFKNALILPCFFGIVLHFYRYKGLFDFMFFITIYIVLYAVSMYKWGINEYENQMIINLYKKVVKK